MSAHPMIAGGMAVLAYATFKWMKRRSSLAEALATKTVLEPSEALVNAHAAELTISRKQWTIAGRDGRVDDSKWLEQRDLFIYRIVEPQAGNITNSLERLLAVWQMIDDATAGFASSRTPEAPVPSAADRAGMSPTMTVVACAA